MHPDFYEEKFGEKTFVMLPDGIPKNYGWLENQELMYNLKGGEWYCRDVPVSRLSFTFTKQTTLDGKILHLLSIKIISKKKLASTDAKTYAIYVLKRVIDKYKRWEEDDA